MASEADIWQPRTIVEAQANTKSVEERIIASAGQSLFVISLFAYTVNTGALEVYKNGLRLIRDIDYVEQTSTTFSLVIPATAGDVILAQGFVGITGTVATLDTDIYETNRQALRDYVGTETTLYNLGHTAANDGGAEFFQYVSGAAPATYVDNNFNIIVPTGGDGSSAWLMEKKPFYDIREAGAKIDGITDDQTAITNTVTVARAAGAVSYFPLGSYLYGVTPYELTGPMLWLDDSFSTGVDPLGSARTNLILLTVDTPTDAIIDNTKSRVAMGITINARGAQHGSGVRSNLNNYSTDGNGCTAFYGRANTTPTTNWSAAVHGETRHEGGITLAVSAEAASYADTGSFYGFVVNNTTAGAEATHPISGNPSVAHSLATGIYVQGGNHIDPKGGWIYGMRFSANSMRDAVGATLIRDDTICPRGLWTSGIAQHSEADIYLEATSANGLLVRGTYTGVGIRLDDDIPVGWNTTGSIRTYWDTTALKFKWLNTAVDRASLDLSASPYLSFIGTKVVGTRKTGWALMTGTADRATVQNTETVTIVGLARIVKALIDDLEATAGHGLIGA